MPKTDYSDPEIQFPRLQAVVSKTDPDAFWIRLWLWSAPDDGSGNSRQQIMNGKRAGSFADIREMIYAKAEELGVYISPDDISIDGA